MSKKIFYSFPSNLIFNPIPVPDLKPIDFNKIECSIIKKMILEQEANKALLERIFQQKQQTIGDK